MSLPIARRSLFLALTMFSLSAAAEKIYLYTENFPPYNMSVNGRAYEHKATDIDGLCTEMIKTIMTHTDLDYVMKLRNWGYGYGRALEKENHGIFCTTYTEDRAPQFKWVGPLTRNLWTIFAPPGSGLKLQDLDAAKGMTIGGYRGDVMTEYLLERGFNVSQLESDDLNPKRLALQQIDLWIADRLAGPYFASQQDVDELVPVYSFNDTELYLAMSLATPDEIVNKLNSGLAKIRASGMYTAIEEKWGL